MEPPRPARFLLLLLALGVLGVMNVVPLTHSQAAEDEAAQLATALAKPVPQGLDELRAMERRVRDLAQRVLPATVSVQVGSASGSGVVISRDGYILTAAHVCGSPGRDVMVIFPDGKHAKAITLGVNTRMDSGLIQITEEGDWPYVEMAGSSLHNVGAWCLATGHPGGYDPNRPGVVRLGRIIRSNSFVLQTDCTLVGGDSGGPLFDMDGKVIGVHSRIGDPTAANFHVPVDTYRLTWDRLTRGDMWGNPQSGGPFLGISGEDHPQGCRVVQTIEGTPAFRAGLRPGDVLTRCNGAAIEGYAGFVEMIAMMQPGEELQLIAERDNKPAALTVIVGQRP